ncbi:uncharacterized protein KQ657_000466 [Scheffersomyces spartinae]|uniref:Uncharacterized protein n=1 Tax=Scheffersomyces spartinae TaxID=45513 RepID=A0A9P7V9N0_9ASCO|nr:uncharacterized protein KQ657_000466 [Scheffersomyces spartinae]KAG7193774.1 hypothetical protein KQ657_000466 [Scheffersomyces spartinae]
MSDTHSHTSELRLKYERSLAANSRRLRSNQISSGGTNLRDKYQIHKANLNKYIPRQRESVPDRIADYDTGQKYGKPVTVRSQESYWSKQPTSSSGGYTRPLYSRRSHLRSPPTPPFNKGTNRSRISKLSKVQLNSSRTGTKGGSMFSRLREYLEGINPFNTEGYDELKTLESSAKKFYPLEEKSSLSQKKVTFQDPYKITEGIDIDPVDEIVQQARNNDSSHSSARRSPVKTELVTSVIRESDRLQEEIKRLSKDVEALREEKRDALSSLRALEMKEQQLKNEIQLTKERYESRISKLEQVLDAGNRDKANLKVQLEKKESSINLRDLQLLDLQKRLERDDYELRLSQKLFERKCHYMKQLEKLLLKQAKLERDIDQLRLKYLHLTKSNHTEDDIIPTLETNAILKTYESIKESLCSSEFQENSFDASTMRDLVERMMSYTDSEVLKKSKKVTKLKIILEQLSELKSTVYLRKVRQIHGLLCKLLTLVQIQILLLKFEYKSQVKLDVRDSGLPYTLHEKWLSFCFDDEGSSEDDINEMS